MSEQATRSVDDPEARKSVRFTTVAERRAFVEARRAAYAERDAPRIRLAAELARDAELTIPPDQGFLSVPPETLAPLTAPVVEDANRIIDSLGPEGLAEHAEKGGIISRGFLPESAHQLGSPYMNLALDERVAGPAAAYLGVLPVVAEVDVWHSSYRPKAPKSSQLWHLDHADTTQVKVWVHLSDIDADSGPLTVLDAASSDRLAEASHYHFGDTYRLPDARVDELLGSEGLRSLEGPKGTVDFTDTSKCFHFGSRVAEGGTPRRVMMVHYLTPYAFKFGDHREQASYRRLASGSSSELERLVLGAA